MELYDTQGRLITYPGIHATTHQDGGTDEISLTGLSGAPADTVNKVLYDAYSILMATSDDTPIALTVAAQTLIGRITGGTVASLTVAQIKTLLGVAAASGIASLDASGVVVQAAVKSQLLNFSRDLTAVAGDVDYEGFNFVPTSLTIFGNVDAGAIASWGKADSAKENTCIATTSAVTAVFYFVSGSAIYAASAVAATFQSAVVKTYGTTCTLTWSKTGSPTGIFKFIMVAFR